MIISFLRRKLKDTSISRKLYFTIGIMALLVAVEMSTLWFAVHTLSSVRAYVEGEGLWSKAQKDAVYHLRIYASSHNEKDYRAFLDFLKVPLGDKKARLELQKPEPNFVIARQGFIEGRNHPEDVDGMIKLILRFHNISYIHDAFVIWGHAEAKMEQLIPLSEQMHALIISHKASQVDIDQLLAQTEEINLPLTKLEDDFSFTLGEGSRWLENIVLKLLLTLSLTIGTTSILITVSVSRGIEKGLKAIIDGAALIKQGLLGTRVSVYSRDEIGVLATAFNNMTATLEDNIQELRDTQEKLKKERDRAETSEKVKQLFLANMSHEIRTPMNAILGFARLLDDEITDKEQHEYIQVIIKSGDDLLVILNDILDFSRIESGKIIFERLPFNLRNIITSVVTMMEPRSRAKKLDFVSHVSAKIPMLIVGDSVRLNQILLNLVSNAIKFTHTGEVSIAVLPVDEGESSIIIEFIVKDTGIGISADKQDMIFESFEQATSGTAREFGGTGLGLSIAKQLVEMQDGKIFVESTPGFGSVFRFRLPFLKFSGKDNTTYIGNEETETMETKFIDGKGLRVLIVEDNPVNQTLLVRILEKQGFETDVADNGKIALTKHNNSYYDIILMDLQMPEMDGYEATVNIRNGDEDKKNIPIIAMTAHTIKGEYEHCMEVGMNAYISKPFQAERLFEKIQALTRKE